MINIEDVLITALKKRSVFHSEADFQHHLAWCIQAELQSTELRLEFPLSKSNSNRWEYCDIALKSLPDIGIELKYNTKLLTTIVGEERFELKNQEAQDIGRYDFLKDIQRLETWCMEKKIDFGYAIMLTNDHFYWSVPRNNHTIDKDFRLHDRSMTGKLKWGQKASDGTMRGRESPIVLKNKYELCWKSAYHSDFKYLFLQVRG